MTDLVYDFITTGVDMIMSAVILSSIVILLYTSSTLSVLMNNQQATSEQVRYYREFNQYDNKIVTSSDVIGTIIYYHGDLPIRINLPSGKWITSDSNGLFLHTTSLKTELYYTTTSLNSAITSGSSFLSEIYCDFKTTSGFGGSVTSITFTVK